jgi:hypothetical protein
MIQSRAHVLFEVLIGALLQRHRFLEDPVSGPQDRWPQDRRRGPCREDNPPALTGMECGRFACRMIRNAATRRRSCGQRSCGPFTGSTAHTAEKQKNDRIEKRLDEKTTG